MQDLHGQTAGQPLAALSSTSQRALKADEGVRYGNPAIEGMDAQKPQEHTQPMTPAQPQHDHGRDATTEHSWQQQQLLFPILEVAWIL